MLTHWPKRVPKLHKHISEKHPNILLTTFKTGVPKCIQTLTRNKVIPKTREARNSQNTRLAKKKGGCRILTMHWA
jgi:hypothetical protein